MADKLVHFRPGKDTLCKLCQAKQETLEHVFFRYLYTQAIREKH